MAGQKSGPPKPWQDSPTCSGWSLSHVRCLPNPEQGGNEPTLPDVVWTKLSKFGVTCPPIQIRKFIPDPASTLTSDFISSSIICIPHLVSANLSHSLDLFCNILIVFQYQISDFSNILTVLSTANSGSSMFSSTYHSTPTCRLQDFWAFSKLSNFCSSAIECRGAVPSSTPQTIWLCNYNLYTVDAHGGPQYWIELFKINLCITIK